MFSLMPDLFSAAHIRSCQDFAEAFTVVANVAILEFIECGKEAEERSLARAALTDNGHLLARRYRKTDIVYRL